MPSSRRGEKTEAVTVYKGTGPLTPEGSWRSLIAWLAVVAFLLQSLILTVNDPAFATESSLNICHSDSGSSQPAGGGHHLCLDCVVCAAVHHPGTSAPPEITLLSRQQPVAAISFLPRDDEGAAVFVTAAHRPRGPPFLI